MTYIDIHGQQDTSFFLFNFYLVVQVPGLIVFLCALPAIYRLVVYFDELPFRTVAEVSKKAAEANEKLNVKAFSFDSKGLTEKKNLRRKY